VENKALCPGKVVLLINFDYSRFFIFCKSRCGVSEMIFTFKVNTMVACAKPASFTHGIKMGYKGSPVYSAILQSFLHCCDWNGNVIIITL